MCDDWYPRIAAVTRVAAGGNRTGPRFRAFELPDFTRDIRAVCKTSHWARRRLAAVPADEMKSTLICIKVALLARVGLGTHRKRLRSESRFGRREAGDRSAVHLDENSFRVKFGFGKRCYYPPRFSCQLLASSTQSCTVRFRTTKGRKERHHAPQASVCWNCGPRRYGIGTDVGCAGTPFAGRTIPAPRLRTDDFRTEGNDG